MIQCKEYENSVENYSLYVHGYWLPRLEQERKAGRLTNFDNIRARGKNSKPKNFFCLDKSYEPISRRLDNGVKYLWFGEVDKNYKACGYGVLHGSHHCHERSHGTFFNDEPHGISEWAIISSNLQIVIMRPSDLWC